MINKVIFKKDEEAPCRVIDSQAIILTVGDSHLHTLNAVGTFIWEALDGKTTVEEIVARVCDEFDVEKEVARKDTIRFLEDLVRRKLIFARQTRNVKT